MNKITPILLISTLLAYIISQKKDNYGLKVDSYILSLQFKPYKCTGVENKFCSNNTEKSNWVIHGLWPNNKEQGQVHFCSQRGFQFEKLKTKTKDQLQKFWGNFSKEETNQ